MIHEFKNVPKLRIKNLRNTQILI